MVDRSKLNRIKGILSARLGAEIPKFNNGAKFVKQKGTKIIYSQDGVNWFNDLDLQLPHIGGVDGFYDVSVQEQAPAFEVKGAPKVTPDTLVENAQTVALKTEVASLDLQVSDKIKQIVEQPINISEQMAGLPEFDTKIETPDKLDDKLVKQFDKLYSDEINLKELDKLLGQIDLGNYVLAGSQLLKGVGDAFGASLAATDSNLTKTADLIYDTAANVISQMGPVGLVVGQAMGFASAAGDIIQSLGGGTDLMTKTDLWMDSSFFSWNIGMLNGFGGKRSNTFAANQDIIEDVGSSYAGSVSDINSAASKSGKKYGLFSSGSRKKANREMAQAAATQNRMGEIADTANDLRLNVSSMGELAGLAYSLMTSGGYNQKYTYAAKHGGLLEWNPTITLEWEPQVEINWELPEFKEGGNIDVVEELEWIPELKSGGITDDNHRTLEQLFEYAKKENPRFIQRLSESPRGIDFIDENGELANGSHLLSYSTDNEGNAIVFPQILEMEDGSLHYFEDWKDAYDRAVKNKNILKMSLKEADLFFAEDPEYRTAYKRGWPDFFKSYKKGGSVGNSDVPEIEETNLKNVIPEGALHKNKHHMEHAEGLTKKGIPVIDEDGELLAEIEHSEIIFTLEVTKKLEEYYEIFYSEESSNKEKEQAALDAGKLLVYQILENTEDRTGLIDSCKKGGTLTLKKSTDELIEEVLDWIPSITIIVETGEEEKSNDKDKKSETKSEKDTIKEAIKEVLIELLTK